MKSSREPDLELRGKLIRSLGALREMLPGSFVERTRACGQPICLQEFPLRVQFDGILANLLRSEEHTSELQSHSDLVCRLLLEKKKNNERNCTITCVRLGTR